MFRGAGTRTHLGAFPVLKGSEHRQRPRTETALPVVPFSLSVRNASVHLQTSTCLSWAEKRSVEESVSVRGTLSVRVTEQAPQALLSPREAPWCGDAGQAAFPE